MAYLPMTQEVIKFMNKNFDVNDIISYQMLITLFGNLFTNEKEFLNDPGDRMGLSHFVENFLRQNNFQTIVTISDLNLIFNSNKEYDIYDMELYKVFFTLIYEELSSNDPQISFRIKDAVFYLVDLIDKSIKEIEQNVNVNEVEENIPQFNNEKEIEQKINEVEENIPQFRNEKEMPSLEIKSIEYLDHNNLNIPHTPDRSNSFIIHNKQYLHEYIKAKNLLPYECSICGLVEWQNEPLKLELDSGDGIYSNLNLENLRFLCPNCYSQVGHYD